MDDLKTAIEKLRPRNDKHIENIVINNIGTESIVEAAKILYKERKLDSPEKQELLKNFDIIKREAALKVSLGLSHEEVVEYLENQGISKKHAIQIIDTNQLIKEDKKSRIAPVIFIIIVLYIIFKIVKLL